MKRKTLLLVGLLGLASGCAMAQSVIFPGPGMISGGGGGGTPWTPASASPVVWLQAYNLALSNGDPISTYADESGNGHDATAAGSLRPIFVTNALNGLAVARFNGSNKMSSAAFTLNGPSSVFLVGSNTWTSGVYYWTDGLGTNTRGVGNNTNGTTAFVYAGGLVSQTGAAISSFGVFGGIFSASGGGSSYNGTFVSGTPGQPAASGYVLGGYGGGAASLVGDIGELIIYGSAANTNLRTCTEGYLAWKWGLQANLPGAHPFKSAAPTTASGCPMAPTAPVVTTAAASSITSTTATAGGNVTSDGGSAVTARGTCYGTSPAPRVTCTSDGTGTGVFTSSLSGLAPSTLYYIAAFATNSVGTTYASDLNFTASAGSGTIYTVGSGKTYATLAACAAVAVAGDTCVVYAGSYAGWTQGHSGTNSSSRINFTVNPGDTVTITSNVIVSGVSHVVIGSSDGSGCGASGTTTISPMGSFPVGGCFIFNSSSVLGGGSGTNTVDVVLGYNNATGAPSNPWFNIPDSYGHNSTDNIVTHNKVAWTGSAPFCENAFYVYGDRNRFEYNDVSGTGDDFGDLGGINLVVRNNYHHDNDMSVSLGCGQSPEHADFVQVIGGGQVPTLSFSLVENNTAKNCTNDGGNCHLLLVRTGSGEVADTVILRGNYAQNFDTQGPIGWGGVGDSAPNGFMYNNTLAVESPLDGSGSCASWQNAATGMAFNNLCYNSSSGTSGYSPFYSTTADLTENANLVYTTGYSGSWMSPYSTEATYSALHNQNPLFANYPTDGTLQGTSPALGTGVAITIVAAGDSGSGTTLILNNAHGFQPGWAGTQGDWIRIGASTTAQITAINYSTNTVTLASGVSRSSGNPVCLYKNSSGAVVLGAGSPNVGAF